MKLYSSSLSYSSSLTSPISSQSKIILDINNVNYRELLYVLNNLKINTINDKHIYHIKYSQLKYLVRKDHYKYSPLSQSIK